MTFDQPQESETAIFPLPRTLDHIDNSPIDVITGIRGIKHREGTTKPEYTFILDKTDAPTTALSLEFEWDGALAADALAHVAERASNIASKLGMPEPVEPEPNKLLRPRRHRH